MRLFRSWPFSAIIYPSALFRIRTGEKTACLTFDDGPDPSSTPAILRILDRFNIKTVFFCSGEAAVKHPELTSLIRSAGHLIGNHGYRHLDGWETAAGIYINNVKEADSLTSDIYFRPPFGRMTPRQYRELSKKYKIILWDIMAYDFDPAFGAEKSLSVLNDKLRPGSIIVLHDSPQSKCIHFLEEFIESSVNRNFRFEITF
ncbi:MAG: polysaccharide deacetylase family protein [Bacteroidota bacterium]